MARARNIKPGLFKNEILAEMPIEYRLLFVGLWTLADREGRLEDRPKRIKLELFPYDSFDVDAGLSDLAATGFIDRYESDGKKVISILSFLKHQTPHGTEKDSELPDKDGCYTIHERGKSGCVTGSKRKINVNSDENNVIPDKNNVNPPLSNGALTVDPPLDNALNPDSLNPDSLNPDLKHTPEAPAGTPDNPPEEKPTITKGELKKLNPEIPANLIDEWFVIRKDKGAKSLTRSGWGKVVNQAGIAGITLAGALQCCVDNHWRGFEAEWLKNKTSGGTNGNHPASGQHHGKNKNGSGGSAFDKVMHEINAARQRDNREPMGNDDPAVRPQVDQQLWREAGSYGGMGSVIEGDFTRDD